MGGSGRATTTTTGRQLAKRGASKEAETEREAKREGTGAKTKRREATEVRMRIEQNPERGDNFIKWIEDNADGTYTHELLNEQQKIGRI